MDPVSIAGSVLGVSTAVKNVVAGVGWITSLKYAPLEIFDLQNELETVQGYLDVLQRALRPLATSPDLSMQLALTQIATCLRVLKADVDSLQQTSVALDLGSRPHGAAETLRKIKWKHHKETIMLHRDRIRRRRMDLAQAVGLLQPIQSERHGNLLLNIQGINRASFESLEQIIHASTERLEASINTRLSTEQPASATRPELSFTNITIAATIRQRCPLTCRCQCHSSRQRFQSTYGTAVAKVLGQLFLRYSSVPIWGRRSCDRRFPECRNSVSGQTPVESMEILYRFPSWLIRRSLYLSAAWGGLSNQGASLHLRVPRILPLSHEVWTAIDRNDVGQLRAMLLQREVLPTDIGYLNTLFGYALRVNHAKECQETILSFGGSLYSGSADGLESKTWPVAYTLFHSAAHSHVEKQIFRHFLSLCGKEEDEEMTPVHEAILLSQNPEQRLPRLRKALQAYPQCLDSPDGIGNTPLHWAVSKGDAQSSRLLIELGANIESRNARGRNPLSLSCAYGFQECVDLLVKSGASVQVAESELSPLAASAMSGGTSADIMAVLLSSGADPNAGSDSVANSPLHYLVFEFSKTESGRHESIRKLDLLLDAGADINISDGSGQSPLLWAAKCNDFTYVELLLQRGADVAVTAFNGKGVLHYLALYGRSEMFRVIRLHHQHNCQDSENRHIELGQRDKDGMTAAEYFKKRVDQTRPQLPEREGGPTQHEVKSSNMFPVVQEDIEKYVLLVEELQSCPRHVHAGQT